MSSSAILCQHCGKMYSSEQMFRQHYLVDHTPDGFECCLKNCHKKFPSGSTASRHMSAHVRQLHSCNVCGVICNTPLYLYVHLTAVHKYADHPTCSVCKGTYSSRASLVQHLGNKHGHVVPSLERRAESCCTVHSPRSFPESDLLLDSLLDHRVKEADLEAAESGVLDLSESGELLSPNDRKSEVTNTPRLVWGIKRPSPFRHDETEFVGEVPRETAVEIPLRQRDLSRWLNGTNSTSDRIALTLDELQKSQRASVPAYLHYCSRDTSPGGTKRYICEACGMTSKDEASLIMSHLSPEDYF